ncbi:TlpA family protein disulfide reductase [Brevundimonas balnearis]|uniref:TlpA family protein disulfide reductase n=1 Tax=Brevundimonas balnearis TaxID=1572858 RepID=A0ABV6R533_9CAUL
MAVSKRIGWMVAGVGALVLVGGGALATLYATGAGPFKAEGEPATAAQSELARFAEGPLQRLNAPMEPVPAPDHVFYDREGAETRLADFRGKVVVVNLWAMWCAPCRTEMPTLQRLAQAYADNDQLVVLPINVDTGETAIADARSFIDVHEPLPMYSDPEFQLPFQFLDPGKMPQTILIDRQGRVRAALSGEADWASPEARALVDALLAEPA